MFRLTVSKDGRGDYFTIQEAVNAVRYSESAEITIREGIYREKLFSEKKNITLKGEGNVFITWNDGARELLSDGFKRGTFRTFTAFFSGEKVTLENLTIQNCAGIGRDVGQALALYLDCDESYLKDVRLIGNQDTLFIAPLPDEEREKRGFYGPRCFSERKRCRAYVEGGSISGSVDFIFGGGDALFRNVEIISVDEGFVAAPCGKNDWDGFVFEECRFTSPLDMEEKVFLMRPWRDEGKAIFRNCTFGKHIERHGFIPWPGRDDKAYLASFEMENCLFI